MRTRSAAARIYELNESYFEQINTPEKAYFLGFIYAEGHLEKDGKNTLTIGLQYGDKYILEYLRQALGSNRPLEFRNRQKDTWDDVSVLRISSLKLTNDIQKLGVPLGHKSYILTFPNFLDKSLIKYFIHGYMDGDGGIYFYDNRPNHFRIGFFGCPGFINGLQHNIDNILNIHGRIGIIKDTLVNYYISGKQDGLTFLNWLYTNPSPIFMKRKYDKFKECVNWNLNTHLTRTRKSPSNIIELSQKSLEIIHSHQ